MSGFQFPEHERKERTKNPKVTKLEKVAKYMGILIHIDGVAYGDLTVEGPELENKPVKKNKKSASLKEFSMNTEETKPVAEENNSKFTLKENKPVIEKNENNLEQIDNSSNETKVLEETEEKPVRKKSGRKPGWNKKTEETSEDSKNEIMITKSSDT